MADKVGDGGTDRERKKDKEREIGRTGVPTRTTETTVYRNGRSGGHTGHHGPRILRPVVVVVGGGLGLIRWPVMHDRRRAAAEAGYRTPAVQRSSCPQKSVPDPSCSLFHLSPRPANACARISRVHARGYTLFFLSFFLFLLFLFFFSCYSSDNIKDGRKQGN